ncbi:MAG: large subunit ribosomal protein [Acidimicrobiaceae bacterium]
MDNPRAEKVAVVTEVREKLQGSDAAVLTEYRGLNVAAMSELRRALRAAGGEYKIYKNTLVRFAARDLGLEIDDLLTGPTAIAFVGGDAAAVAKTLRDYGKTNPALVVKGGLLGTRIITSADVTALADLPSREQLLSQIAGLFAAPMQQFAGLLAAVPRDFAYALQALIEKGGGPDAPTEAPAPAAAPEPEPVAEAEAPAAEAEVDTAEAPVAEADTAEAPATDAPTAVAEPAAETATETDPETPVDASADDTPQEQ